MTKTFQEKYGGKQPSKSLYQVVVEAIEKGETESDLFQQLMRIYGRKRFAQIWKAYKKDGKAVFKYEYWKKEG